ncbi:hypothetical protein IFM89_005321 [Coptis chinensis]|uniref:ethanolamine-phosphate cytidylyltransferase n=1 Tax=Coptis chinensis TaxID=261450 RepID=A0A835H8W5_9MAGN|nr:hypothetical protein IFM89_005321 [Coptis chinensis]
MMMRVVVTQRFSNVWRSRHTEGRKEDIPNVSHNWTKDEYMINIWYGEQHEEKEMEKSRNNCAKGKCLEGMSSSNRGAHRPIMNLHERSLSVLACRYVDEVIIGAPWEVSKDMITTFNISLVVHGTVAENNDFQMGESNPYVVPISMGIYRLLESPLDITTTTIIKRIVSNQEAFQVILF